MTEFTEASVRPHGLITEDSVSVLDSPRAPADRIGSDQHLSLTDCSPSDAVSQSVALMSNRGIDNPQELLAFASPERILAACRWWDTKPGAGAGVLARVIRQGGIEPQAASKTSSLLEEQDRYGESIVAWLREKLPDVCDEGRPHPAAIAAVIRLHGRYGRGSLTPGDHGDQVRLAVKVWHQRFDRPPVSVSDPLRTETDR